MATKQKTMNANDYGNKVAELAQGKDVPSDMKRLAQYDAVKRLAKEAGKTPEKVASSILTERAIRATSERIENNQNNEEE